MKIQIDTNEKTVKIEGAHKISLIIDTLEKLLPNVWKNFTLESNTVIQNWSTPIIIKEYVPQTYPWYPIINNPVWVGPSTAPIINNPNITLCDNTLGGALCDNYSGNTANAGTQVSVGQTIAYSETMGQIGAEGGLPTGIVKDCVFNVEI